MATEPQDSKQPDVVDLDTNEHPYPPAAATQRDITKLEIDVKEDPFQVSAIVQKIDRNLLILTPDFQRKEVWDRKKRSEFIESILLNYPLPPLYLNQDRGGRYIVVDGLQRSSTVYRFVKNEFELVGIETLTWLNGSKFNDLDPVLQSRIEDRKLLCYVLKPSVSLSVVCDIFARINRGGMPLNRQEIRHGLYQGKSTTLLKRVAGSPEFSAWIGRLLGPDRMGDEEAALRCIAFARADPEKDYRGDLDKFLESALVKINSASDAEIDAVEQTFLRAFSAMKAILGEDAFRIPTGKTRGRINIAVMESAYRFFAEHPEGWLHKNSRQIRKGYSTLIDEADFRDAVRSSTGDTRRVRTRFRMARELLGEHCAD